MRTLVFALLLFLVSCNGSPLSRSTPFVGWSHEISYRLLIGQALSSAEKKEIENLLEETFELIDLHFNNWNPISEVSKINGLSAGEVITLSSELASVLHEVDRLHALTEGRFDPTVAPLARLWKERLRLNATPSEEELQPLLSSIGWHHIHLAGSTLWKDHDLTALDLGAICKGYAVDLIAAGLMSRGYDRFYVEWGGELCTRGLHPEGRKWKISISGLTTAEMEDGAIATSGDTYQSWAVGGQIYTHLIDPHKKAPCQRSGSSIKVASVQASSCLVADALSTALMIFPNAEEAADWAKSHLPHVTCFISSGTTENFLLPAPSPVSSHVR